MAGSQPTPIGNSLRAIRTACVPAIVTGVNCRAQRSCRYRHVRERPETWVTERTGHIGNTFRQRLGGVDAVEGMFGYGRAPTVRVSPARGRGHDGRVPGVRYLAQDRLQNLSALSEAWPGGAE